MNPMIPFWLERTFTGQSLLAKKTSLEEIRAYVVLRGSLLMQDDKKRVILESDASGSGQLDMTKVKPISPNAWLRIFS